MADPIILAAALEYAAAGIFVFPASVTIGPDGKKKVWPCADWDAASTTDPEHIRQVFGPDTRWTSVCIDTGKSGLVVVDADGAAGIEAWRALSERVPPTAHCATPGGGEHHYYRADSAHPISIDSSGKVAPGVDIRGQGGFAIAPPSSDARGAYRWLPDDDWSVASAGTIYVPAVVIERMGIARRDRDVTGAARPGAAADPFSAPVRPFTRDDARRFCASALADLDGAGKGQVNHYLNTAAKILYRFVPGIMDRAAADARLSEGVARACAANGTTQDPAHDRSTLDSAWGASRRDWIATLDEPDPTSAPAGDEPAGAGPDERERKISERLEWMEIDREARIRISARDRPELPDVLSLSNALTIEFPELEWAVEGLMPREGICLFSAPQKAGKTTTVGNLVRSLADGDKFLDHFRVPEPLKVGVLDTESGERRLYGWLADQRIQRTDNVRVVSLRGREAAMDPRDPRCRASWLPALEGLDIAVLDVVGPVVAALGLDENDNPQVGQFWTAWRTLLMEAGVRAGLVVHHTGHNEARAIGASAWLRYPDAIWKLEREDEDPTSARYFSAYGRDVDVQRGGIEYDSITRRSSYTTRSKGATMASRHVPVLADLLREHGPQNHTRCISLLRAHVDGLSRDKARDVPTQGVRDRVLRMWTQGKSEVYGVAAEHGFMP